MTFKKWSPFQSHIFSDVFKCFMCSVNVIMPLILFAETCNFILLSRGGLHCSAISGVFFWALEGWNGFVSWKQKRIKEKRKTNCLQFGVQWLFAPQVSEQSTNKVSDYSNLVFFFAWSVILKRTIYKGKASSSLFKNNCNVNFFWHPSTFITWLNLGGC